MNKRKRDVYYWQERISLKNMDVQWQESTVFKIADEKGIEGIGAATPNNYFGETFKTTMAVIEHLRNLIENENEIDKIQNVEDKMSKAIKRDNAAKTAVGLALCDYINKKYEFDIVNILFPVDQKEFQEKLFRVFWKENLNITDMINNYYNKDYILKIEFLEKPTIQDFFNLSQILIGKKIWLDLKGLFNFHELNKILEILKDVKIVSLEQPLERNKESKIMEFLEKYQIFWDESIESENDILRLYNMCNGVVLDITKVGGILNMKKLFDLSNSLNLQTVISSRLEHSINIYWSNKIKNAFDFVDLNFEHYIK